MSNRWTNGTASFFGGRQYPFTDLVDPCDASLVLLLKFEEHTMDEAFIKMYSMSHGLNRDWVSKVALTLKEIKSQEGDLPLNDLSQQASAKLRFPSSFSVFDLARAMKDQGYL